MFNNVLDKNESSRNFLSDFNISCSFAMDDGGRCLLDVINDPLLLQSFLESGSDENSKDPQDGTSSESAVESPQVSRNSHTVSNHLSSAEHIADTSEPMGYSYAIDQGLLAQSGVCSVASGLGGMSLVVSPSSIGPSTYHHASSSGATIHHVPSTVSHTSIHPHSPISTRSATPLSHSIKSPGQGPSSVHSMPPPSPLQQTRSPLPSHTPSPAPSWSPAPPVLSPATSRTQSSVPSVSFQQSHNQILQTSCSVTQFVTALASQSITQKLTLQQQQQLFLHQQLSPAAQQSSRLTSVNNPVVTTAVTVTPSMVQLIPAPQSTVPLPLRTSHTTVRPIQPKLPPQILPKPSGGASNQFVAPSAAAKQAATTPVTTGQRTVGVGISAGATGQLVIGQSQPGVFSQTQGTIVLNQIIPGVGQSPILIQGNLANIPGLQLTLRPPNSVSPGQSLSSSAAQNNATLIAALQGPSQHAQTVFAQAKSPIHGQQTIMIPNNLAHTSLTSQNINLTSAGIPNSSIMSSSSQGQGFLARSNIILSPRVVGPNQGIQLQQIQTPQGPILAFAPSQAIVPHLQTALQNAALGNSQLAPVTVPMHSVMTAGQGVLSSLSLQSHPPPQSALQQQQQSLFGAAVPFSSHLEQTSHQVIQVPHTLTPQVPSTHASHIQTPQQVDLSPKPASPPKPSKVPAVNLEELLKEHGIVPENSPPPSPDSNSPLMEESVPSQIQVNTTVVPSSQLITALQSQQVVLEQLSQSPQAHSALPQLKLALTQDGSVILQPHTPFSGNPRIQHYVSSGHVHGRITNTVGSVILPTVTTSSVSVPVVATESSTARGHSALLARLNASPALSVPDVMTSMVLTSNTSSGGSTSSSTTTTTITTTTTTLVPLTVQSLNVNSSPIASNYVMQRTNSTPITSERVLGASSPNHVKMSVATSSCTVQNVQNRINHLNSGCYQTIIVSSDQTNGSTAHNVSKTVQSPQMVKTSTFNSPNAVQVKVEKCGNIDKHSIEVADNNGAIVPSHNLTGFTSGVPNHVLQRLQKEISDLLTLKYRSLEQQKSLQELIAIQQKITMQPKHGSKNCRANLNPIQIKRETEILEKLSQRSPINKTVLIAEQSKPQQMMPQSSLLPIQLEKQQNVSNSKATHSVHLVNLLKQNSESPMKLSTSTTTPSMTTLCDSTVTTTSPTTSHQRVGNEIVSTSPHQQCPKTSEHTQPQVITRVQALTQPQTVPVSLNSGQMKGTIPVNTRVKNVIPKTVLISERLTKDQNEAVSPDVTTPFSSKTDACERLLKYHVFNSKVPSIVEIQKADETFDMVSVQLLDKATRLKNKFHFLQLKESMRPCATPERILLERLFLEHEQSSLQADKALVEEGKTLSLPPVPSIWLKDLKTMPSNVSHSQQRPISCKVESRCLPQENIPQCFEEIDDPVCEASSNHLNREEVDLIYKEDSDNLEAPVIDSCADIAVPQHDDNCERSPPTLKRIVIKPDKLCESDSEEPILKKRVKFQNSSIKTDTNWNCDSLFPKASNVKSCEKEDVTANHRYPQVNLLHDSFQSDNREEDIMSKIRKELNISPMEMDDDSETVGSHVVDFDPPNSTNELADFEPPVARTEETQLTSYSSNMRSNCDMKYDFDMLGCPSEWAEAYVNHVSDSAPNESEVAVESILDDHHNPSDLDLSGLDGLEDHMEESRTSIPNGIQDDESELNYIGFRIPKQKKCQDSSATTGSVEENCGDIQDQVQSAIKSILEMRPDNRSYFGADDRDLMPRIYDLEKRSSDLSKQSHSHNTHIASFRSLDSDKSGESDAALDEAVRSILQ